jgi:hypothetical protein
MYSIPVNITLENLNIGDTYNIKLNGQDVSSIYPTGLSFFAYKPSQNFSIVVNKEENKLALINIVSTNNRTRIVDSSSIFLKCNHETICNIDLSDPGRPTFETVYPTPTPTETPTLTPTPTSTFTEGNETPTPTPTNFENTPTPTPTPTNPANLFNAKVCASTPPGWGSSGVLFDFLPRINKSYTIQGVTFNAMGGSLWWNDTPPEFDPPNTHILDSTPMTFPTTSNTRRLNFVFNPWSGGLGSLIIVSEISAFSISKNNNIVAYTVASTITDCDTNPSLIGSNIDVIYTVDTDSGNPQINEQSFCLTNYDDDDTQNGFLQNISITINSETLLLP